ncbi:hypothetical protein ISS37_03155 [candidate division KSB1 bacterium]|nr:hypothetical protein [candidate division KSB1 bacterium]
MKIQKVLIRFFTEDMALKVGLLLLASFVWFFVVTNLEYEYAFSIPISIENLKEGKILVKEVPQNAQVLFRGNGRNLLTLRYLSDVKLRLDLKTINWYYDFILKNRYVELPRGMDVKVVEVIEPDTVTISLDDLLEKEVPVLPQVSCKLKAGYVQVGEVRCDPPKIRISGPRSLVAQINGVRSIESKYFDAYVDIRDRLQLEPFSSPSISRDRDYVTVIVDVQKLGEHWLEKVPVRVVNVPKSLTVIVEPPEFDSMLVRGGVDEIMKLSPEKVVATINFGRNWRPEKENYSPLISLPEGIEVVSFDPPTFVLIVRKSR